MNGSRAWLEKDFYKVLGVGEDASADEIKRAYKKLASKFHPDRNPGDQAAEDKMKDISEAYDVLSDDAKRQEYDQLRHMSRSGYAGGVPGAGWQTNIRFDDLPFDVGDLFGGMFGGGRQAARGNDVEATIRIPFETAIRGTTVEANGSKVKIPPGIKDGQKVRARGRGRAGAGGSGDLFVRVHVDPHPVFARDGDDLTVTVSVPFTTAALGGTLEAPTLEGEPVRLKVPAGTQSGRTLRVRGRGVRRSMGGQGDLLVTVQVAVPTKLTDEQREVIQRLAALNGDGTQAGTKERV